MQRNRDMIEKMIEKTEPTPNLKHVRNLAQPLQRNSSDIIHENTNHINAGVKLDPSILKYSNQPVAIVAPSKSNSNTLERKKHINEEIATLSLRTINVSQSQIDQKQGLNCYQSNKFMMENGQKCEYNDFHYGSSHNEDSINPYNSKNDPINVSTSSASSSDSSHLSDSSSKDMCSYPSDTSITTQLLKNNLPKADQSSKAQQSSNKANSSSSSTPTNVTQISKFENTTINETKSFQKAQNSNAKFVNQSRFAPKNNEKNNLESQRDSGFIDDKIVNGEYDNKISEHKSGARFQNGKPPIFSSSNTNVKHYNHEMIKSPKAPVPKGFDDSGIERELSDFDSSDKKPPANNLNKRISLSPVRVGSNPSALASSSKNGAVEVYFKKTNSISEGISSGLALNSAMKRKEINQQSKLTKAKVNFSDEPTTINNLVSNTTMFNNDENSVMNSKEIGNTNLSPSKLKISMLSNDFYKMPYFNTNESGKIINNTKLASQKKSPNDENDPISITTMSSMSIENSSRKFTDALQKASQIEDIITRRKAAQNTEHSCYESPLNESNRHKEFANDSNMSSWMKRQTAESSNCLPPPLHSESTTATSSSNSFEHIDTQNKHGNDFNPDEFQFFINAIEKLKATSLFQEEDLKKMTDEQIYEALIEHARKQRSNRLNSMQQKAQHQQLAENQANSNPNATYFPESIDKEQEEDLPIIMRNLHSVKSLKHFFEIRAKSGSSNQSSGAELMSQLGLDPNSPLVQAKSQEKEKKTNTLQGLFIKNSQLIEKSVKQGVGIANRDVSSPESKQDECPNQEQICNENEARLEQNLTCYREEIDTGVVHATKTNATLTTMEFVSNGQEETKQIVQTTGNQITLEMSKDESELIKNENEFNQSTQCYPVPPPLPDFLLNPSLPIQFKSKAKTQSNSNTLNSQTYMTQKELQQQQSNYGNDLHDKLIKEIHNKSLERSKKDTGICLDERGNLISKPVNRAYNSSKNQKLHRIKDALNNSNQSNYGSLSTLNNKSNNSLVAEKISQLNQSLDCKQAPKTSFIKNNKQSSVFTSGILSTATASTLDNDNINEDNRIYTQLEANNLVSSVNAVESSVVSFLSKPSMETLINSQVSLAATNYDQINRLNHPNKTTTTLISNNSGANLENSPVKPPLNSQKQTAFNKTNYNLKQQFDLTSSQSEIKDPSVVITRSFLLNSNTDENLDNLNRKLNSYEDKSKDEPCSPKLNKKSIAQQLENELSKKFNSIKLNSNNTIQTDRVSSGLNRANIINDENDNVTELISISQVPSVIPTLDRRDQNDPYALSKINELANLILPPDVNDLNDQNENLARNKFINDQRRTTSFRSDFSTNSNGSGASTRSMLSEARAKLEAFSGKFSKLNNSFNNGTNYLNINKNLNNNFSNINSISGNVQNEILGNEPKILNNNNNNNENIYEDGEYVQTKF